MRGLLCFLLLIYELGSAQTKLPDDFHKSPDFSSLINDVIFSSSFNNGATENRFNLDILKVNKYQNPIKVDNSTNEIRVDNSHSRASPRRSLNPGENVNKVINVESDGPSPFLIIQANVKQKYLVLYEFVNNESTLGHEIEWHEYSYFFNGHKGIFYVENKGSGVYVKLNSLKKNVNGCNKSVKKCKIITRDDVNNIFGFTTKENRHHKTEQNYGKIPFVTEENSTVTACFLDQIVSADSEVTSLLFTVIICKNTINNFLT